MEIRTGAELGLKVVSRGEAFRPKPDLNPANIPGKNLGDQLDRQLQTSSNALRPSHTKENYIVSGGTINVQA